MARISPGLEAGPWRDELRATLALAWPLILANLTQQAIQATDVLLMGRLGATQLAAATLALNLTFTFNIFLLGLITASSPMMATALTAVQRGSRCPKDISRGPLAYRHRNAALLADPLACRGHHAGFRPVGGTR